MNGRRPIALPRYTAELGAQSRDGVRAERVLAYGEGERPSVDRVRAPRPSGAAGSPVREKSGSDQRSRWSQRGRGSCARPR